MSTRRGTLARRWSLTLNKKCSRASATPPPSALYQSQKTEVKGQLELPQSVQLGGYQHRIWNQTQVCSVTVAWRCCYEPVISSLYFRHQFFLYKTGSCED